MAQKLVPLALQLPKRALPKTSHDYHTDSKNSLHLFFPPKKLTRTACACAHKWAGLAGRVLSLVRCDSGVGVLRLSANVNFSGVGRCF